MKWARWRGPHGWGESAMAGVTPWGVVREPEAQVDSPSLVGEELSRRPTWEVAGLALLRNRSRSGASTWGLAGLVGTDR